MSDATGVVGAGLMGIGIAVQLARAGRRVHVVDADPQRLPGVAPTAMRILGELAQAGLHAAERDADVLARITTGQDVAALEDTTWMVEAVPERLTLKHAVYADLERVLDEQAVLASNTSSIMPSQLVLGLRTRTASWWPTSGTPRTPCRSWRWSRTSTLLPPQSRRRSSC